MKARPLSLWLQLTVNLCAGALVGWGLLTLYYQQRIDSLLTQEADARISALVQQLAAGSVLGTLAQSPDMLTEPLAAALAQADVLGVAVYSNDGNLIAQQTQAQAVLQPPPAGSWAACAACALPGDRLRWVTAIQRAQRATDESADAPPSAGAAPQVGWFVAEVTQSARRVQARQVLLEGVGIAISLQLGGMLVIVWLTRRVVAPLGELARATREIGQGNWQVPLPRGTFREMLALANDFAGMVQALAALDAENQRLQRGLEARVAARTEELQAANTQLQALLESKDQFVATVSHDFRSPLAVVLSSVQTVLADPQMPPDTRGRFLQRAEHHCRRLQRLVRDLLDLARLQQHDLQWVPVQLERLLAGWLEQVQDSYAERQVQLTHSLQPARVLADANMLERAVTNLLDNALKFTPAAGQVHVQLSIAGTQACIEVRDTGPGIAAAEQARVWERFYQGPQGTAAGDGSGLGLAIVAGVVQKHGGTVALRSAPGQGASFAIALPLA